MLHFRCFMSPREHIEAWLQKEHDLSNQFLDDIIDIAAEVMKVERSFIPPENVPNRKYFRRAREYLEEKSERDAVVTLLRSKKDRRILQGSTRVPLQVKTNGGVYIIKPYDAYDEEMEREVLQRVSGKIGPQVLHFGKEFYSEELIDLKKYDDLYEMCLATGAFSKEKRRELFEYSRNSTDTKTRDRLMKDMAEQVRHIIRKGGVIHGKLAQLGVVYDHNHWLDEFHVAEGRNPVVIDFGTSWLFHVPEEVEEAYPKAQSEVVKGKEELTMRHDNSYFVLYDRVKRMEMFQQYYRMAKKDADFGASIFPTASPDGLAELRANPALSANLTIAASTCWDGLKRFFEGVAIGSGHDYTGYVSDDLHAGFAEGYFS